MRNLYAVSASQMFIVVGLLLGAAVGVGGAWLPHPAKIPFRWVAGVFGLLLAVDVCFAALQPHGADDYRNAPVTGTPLAAASAPHLPSGTPSGTVAPSVTPSAVPSSSTPAAPAGPSAVPVAPPSPDPLFLDGLKPVAGSGDAVLAGDASIRGVDYPHSVGLCAGGLFALNNCADLDSDTWLEYAVAPGYGHVTATVGLSTTSVANCRLHAQILVDNTEVWSQDLNYGDADPVTAPVDGGHRVRLQMHAESATTRCDLIYGNVGFRR